MKFVIWKGPYSGIWHVSLGETHLRGFPRWEAALDWANRRAHRALSEAP